MLPVRQEGTERPVTVRFTGRIGKVHLRKKKLQLREFANLQDVKIYKNLTLPRLRFFNLMRNDTRFQNVCVREEVIYLLFSGDNEMDKKYSLYKGREFLGYNTQDVRNCYKVQRNNQQLKPET